MNTERLHAMKLPAELPDETLGGFLNRLRQIFADMDQKYEKAAAHYGFQCRGCEDNCCLTRFHHHTFLEFFFIRDGFRLLDPSAQIAIRSKAEAVCRRSAQALKIGSTVRLMCPLNAAGLCRLYPYRPMICRLHGIPHELHKPGQPVSHGPGCNFFEEHFYGKPYYKFDRTPFYFEIAGLENEFKQATGLSGRIKLTIAEMIIRIEQGAEGIEQGAEGKGCRA